MDNLAEAGAAQDFRNEAHAATVQGSVDYLELSAVSLGQFGTEPQRQKVAEIQFVDVGAHGLDLAAAKASLELHLRGVLDLSHFRYDFFVHGGSDLTSVGPGYLVAVILLGVVRGGDHDAGDGALEAYRVAHFRRGTDIVEDEHMDAVGRQHLCRDAGEHLAVVSGVE